MEPTRTRIILRRFNNTLRICVPHEFLAQRELCGGDHCVWIEEDDGSVRLKFYKVAELEELAETTASAAA